LAYYNFHYQQDYSAGGINLTNRKGWGAFLNNNLNNGYSLNTAYAHISVFDRDIYTNYLAAELQTRYLIPKSKISLRGDWVTQQKANGEPLNNKTELALYSLDITAKLIKSVELGLNHGWGEPISFTDNEDLRSGVPVPMITSSLSFGTRVNAKYKITDTWVTSANYSNSGIGHKTAEVLISRNISAPGEFKFKIQKRFDLTNKQQITSTNIEYSFLSGGGDLIGLSAVVGDKIDGVNASIYLRLSSLLTWDGVRPYMINKNKKIRAATGGIRGFVYLDSNTNGRLDPGEKGLSDIDVVVNGKLYYISDEDGWFYIPRSARHETIVIALDVESLPAIFTPTQGVQQATWAKGTLTRINLGIAALTSATGKIIYQENHEKSFAGAVINLVNLADQQVAHQSITDGQGEYYFGELSQGQYQIQIDADSMPDGVKIIGELPTLILTADEAGKDIEIPTSFVTEVH
jgi:hypothetical protein